MTRTLSTDSSGNVTVEDATLDVTGTFADAAGDSATVTIHTTGDPTAFDTTITQTGTGLFADLNVTIDAGDAWLDNFLSQLDSTIQNGAADQALDSGSSQSANGVAFTNTGGYTTTQTSDGAVHVTTVDAQGNVLLDEVTNQATGAVLYKQTATYDANGNELTSTDGLGRTTAWTYDSAGHKISETDAYGTPHATTTTYVWQDNYMVEVIDPDGNATSYTYDAQGNELSATDPLGNVTSYTYDANGNKTSQTNPDGSSIAYTYDATGRETQEVWYDAGGNVVDMQNKTYDANGDLLTASNDQGEYDFTYNAAGQLIHVVEPGGVWLSFRYDTAGNQTSVTDSFGDVETSTYDGNHHLESRTFVGQGQDMRLDFTYTAAGQVATIMRYSDLAGTHMVAESFYGYDPMGNVTEIKNTGASGSVFDDFKYTYDVAGELTSETDNGVPTNYAYDATGQLVSAGGNGYSYDPNGNRTMSGYVTGLDNQVLSDGTYDYTYDAEGNTLTKLDIATRDTWTYGYDPENQLTSAVETNAQGDVEVAAEYKYDVFGNRIEQDTWTPQAGEQVQRYALDGWNPAKPAPVGNENFDVWADLDASGSLTTVYVRGDVVDQLFGRVDVAGGTSSTSWTLTDHLGSVRDVVANNGNFEDSIAYDAYGNITSETDSAERGRYAWSGRELDVETGLQYNRARYYDSTIGRWISQDPMGFAAGDSNLYRYVKNAPTDATDPSGMDGAGFLDTLTFMVTSPWQTTKATWRGTSEAVVVVAKETATVAAFAATNPLTAASAGGEGAGFGGVALVDGATAGYIPAVNQYVEARAADYGETTTAISRGAGVVVREAAITGLTAGTAQASRAVIQAGTYSTTAVVAARTVFGALTVREGVQTVQSGIATVEAIRDGDTVGAVVNGAATALGAVGTVQGARATVARAPTATASTPPAPNNQPGIVGRLAAGAREDVNGLTVAGRALEKHGSRPGSVFPGAAGNVAAKNAQGQQILEGILRSNNQRIVPNRFGGQDIFDISTGRGVRFDSIGNMMGFLEP